MHRTSREQKICLATLRRRRWRLANPESDAYTAAKQRCQNPNNPVYFLYGGRGIRFKLKSWRDIIADIGRRPPGLTLDRIDNDGHYEAGNLRWATMAQQGMNKRVVNQTGFCRGAICTTK